jgi:beta-galactosidase
MKQIIIILLVIIGCITSSSAKEVVSLNGKWMFCYAKDYQSADEIEKSGFYRPDYNPTNSIRFDEIEVPSCWAILGYEEPIYRGYKNDKASEGLYIRHFTLPDDYKRQKGSITFWWCFRIG